MKAPDSAVVGEVAFKAWCSTLQLAPEDERKQAWLGRLVGIETGARISLATSPEAARSIMGAPESTTAVRCTACGGTFVLPEFVAAFALEYATKPRCGGCR